MADDKELEALGAQKDPAFRLQVCETDTSKLNSAGDDDFDRRGRGRGIVRNPEIDVRTHHLSSKENSLLRRKSRDYPITPFFSAPDHVSVASDNLPAVGNSDCTYRGTKISDSDVCIVDVTTGGSTNFDRRTKGLTRAEQRLYAAADPTGYAAWLFLVLALLSTALVAAAAAAADPVFRRLWLPGAMPPPPLHAGLGPSPPGPSDSVTSSLPVRGRHSPAAGAVAAAVRQGLLLRLLHRLLPDAGAARRGGIAGRVGTAAAGATARAAPAEAREGVWFPAAHVPNGPGPQQSRR